MVYKAQQGVRHIGVQILLANQVKKRLNMRCSHNIPLQYLPLDLGLFFLLGSPHYSKLFFKKKIKILLKNISYLSHKYIYLIRKTK